MILERKQIAVFLIILGFISILFQIYQADFQIPIYSDNLDLLERAFAHSQGNFDMSPNRNFGCGDRCPHQSGVRIGVLDNGTGVGEESTAEVGVA